MSRLLHTVSILTLTLLAQDDRLEHGHASDLVIPAGRGGVASIAAGTPGAGYQTIPTVAVNIPASGAGATGSAAAATAVMGVNSATINAAGSGYTNGTQTLTGSDGTGTKFQLTVTVAGNVVTAVTAVSVAGAYTAMPTAAAAPVTGGGGTGATFVLNMGVVSYTVGAAGTLYPSNLTTASVSGGTPTTPAVPGAVAITSAAGQGSAVDIAQNLPGKFSVAVAPSEDCTSWITNKSNTGFTVNFAPRLAANTLAAGTFDLTISA